MENVLKSFCVSFVLIFILVGCDDDGLLPLSEYENVDVNIYFYSPDNTETYLGKTRGAKSCGNISHSYARQKNLERGDGWSYICCTIYKGDQCYHKIR